MLDIHSGSCLTASFHKVGNFLKIKSLALCSLMELISALIHNKASILLFGQGLATLIMFFFSAWLQVISYSCSPSELTGCLLELPVPQRVKPGWCLRLEPFRTEKITSTAWNSELGRGMLLCGGRRRWKPRSQSRSECQSERRQHQAPNHGHWHHSTSLRGHRSQPVRAGSQLQ